MAKRPTSAAAQVPPARPRRPRAGPSGPAFERLVDVMAILRGPGGCAWDRKQTHESLRGYLIEETYEAVDAIDAGNLDELKGELGDVLLQCVFHAQLASESGRFGIVEVIDAITGKLIRRHPHIFAADGRPLTARERKRAGVSTPDGVREQWARLKATEQLAAGAPARLLAGVPRALPALLRAHKIASRAATVGFDWASATDVVAKIEEEVRELREAVAQGPERAADEMGDLLFAIANLARKLGIESESALAAANDKFTARFDALEAWFQQHGRDVHGASLEELEAVWQQVKVGAAAAARPARSGRSRSAASPTGRRSPRSPRRRDRT